VTPRVLSARVGDSRTLTAVRLPAFRLVYVIVAALLLWAAVIGGAVWLT
jgi:hypothetical protein